MKSTACNLPDSILKALQERMESDKGIAITRYPGSLSLYLGKSFRALFQASTSDALVESPYRWQCESRAYLPTEDFGVGTSIELDAEMVVLDRIC